MYITRNKSDGFQEQLCSYSIGTREMEVKQEDAEGDVTLYRLLREGKVDISREEVEKLWKNGKLVAMFNIPFDNPSLFHSCRDFAIQEESMNKIEKNWKEECAGLQIQNKGLKEINGKIISKMREIKEENAKLNERLLLKEEEREKWSLNLNSNNQKQSKKIRELEREIESLSLKISKQREEMNKSFEEKEMKINAENESRMKKMKNSLEEEHSVERERMRQFMEKRMVKERALWNSERHSEEESIQDELDSTKDLVKELVKQNKDLSKRMKEMKDMRDQYADRNRELESQFYSHPATENINRELLVSFYKSHPETSNETVKLDFYRDHPMSAALQENLFEEEDEW